MRYLNMTQHITLLLTLCLLSACASTATRAFKTGEKLDAEGKYEEAMYSYAESFKSDPSINTARIRFLNSRQKAADQHFQQGMLLVEKGNHTAALAEFKAAQGIDPTQDRFAQRIEISTRYKNAEMAFQEGQDFEKANKLKDAHRQFIKAVELFPENSEYKAAIDRIIQRRKSTLDGYELRLKSSKPITLKFKDARMKDVFTILTQLSGINFVFDEGVKDAPVSIFLENASFQQILDLLTNMNKLGTKNLNETTVLVYLNTPEKSKQYDDMVMRTFNLNYMEAKKAINLIRTMIQVRKIYVNEESNSIVIRDTEDVVAVVEKILDANDMPDAEVVLDVEVIEINNKNAENLGLLLSNYNVQLGAFNGSNALSTTLAGVTTTSTDVTSTAATINNLVKAFSMKGYGGYVTVPNATFNFGKTLAKGEVLSNPKIRVKNKEKAKFNVGTRVPITTTTLNGTVSQVNVQYVDVGVKVNAEPTIQLNNEITIKLNLEVSSILQKETVGSDKSTSVVTIGTRNVETVLSLKDGETSIIGGLIQKSDNNDKAKIYLLSDIPLIGALFTNSNSSKDKTELMLAITPRLVRGVSVPLPGLASFASGKEDHPSLDRPMASFDLEPVFEGEAQPKEAEKKNGTPATVASVPQPTEVPTTPATPAVAVPVPVPAPAAVRRSLLQLAAPLSATIGQQFGLDIKISEVNDLVNAPFVLKFDPALVDFVGISEGTFMKKDGKATTFGSMADSVAGTVTVTLGITAGNNGVSGGGTLATALFRAKKQGLATFAFGKSSFEASLGAALDILPFSTAVDIR